MVDQDSIFLEEQIAQLRERGICVIIPTYNNDRTIVEVVRRVQKQCEDIIVVNDGCTDSTADLLQNIEGITVVSFNTNQGKGKALQMGFRKALEMGFTYAITLDADGQHYPEDIHLFLEYNKKYPGSILLGKRNLEEAVRSFGSKFANAFSNFWFCVQTLQYVPDTQTGFRLYPLHKLSGLQILTSRYEAELEVLVFSAWHGVDIATVPIHVYYPPMHERVSHFKPGSDFFRISLLNTILCILAAVYGWPLVVCRSLRTILMTAIALLYYLFGVFCIISPFAWIYVPLSRIFSLNSQPIRSLLHLFGSWVVKLLPLVGVKTNIVGNLEENFSKPAVIICNHQSHLDLMMQLSLSSKIVFLTNDWVWNSPFFGFAIRHAEYYPVSAGIEELMPKLRSLVGRGYSISVFPEGMRSPNGKIGRFHKGAFYIAQELGIDILPMILYGANHVLPKKGKYLRMGKINLTIGNRISTNEQQEMATTLQKRAQFIRKLYIRQFNRISNKYDKNA